MDFNFNKILAEGTKKFFDMLIPILTSKAMLIVFIGIIFSAIVSFVIKRVSYDYFRITGDSKRKAKKKSKLLDTIVSLIDLLRKK